MPFEQHPTDPDKLVMRAGNYNLQKPWVGLTDEDKYEIIRVTESDHYHDILMLTEAKLKEKNT